MAAMDERAIVEAERQRFRQCSSKLMSMVAGEGEAYKTPLNSVLDQFISLDYCIQFVTDKEASAILNKVCTLVPLKYELLVTKACQVIVNIVAHQQITLNQDTLDILLEYIITATKTCQSWTLPDTLRALGAIVYENGANCGKVGIVWNKLLGGPAPNLLQSTSQNALRSCMCDCLSNIGSPVFELLALDKRILCITMLLGLSVDEDYRVKSSAVRALGVYVVYPCLREDVLFVADTANVILNCLEDASVLVRMKAAWSLGNLSDALVMNKDSSDAIFLQDFSDMLLQRLFTSAIKASEDNDKVKSNGVRAIGNLLRYIKPSTMSKSGFTVLVEQSVQALVKNVIGGTMKVRWNACYAVGNMFKNADLPVGSSTWTSDVYDALLGVVADCKNFKVRINAALAIAIPLRGRSMETYNSFAQYGNAW
uniref:HEAT repeat-containing protein 6-like n=1 Tax=Saccoglossus kowalevskii TaxID=10224 RepID=A0ABM0M723_SACKO|nr:PREDICTED: HEAT repeat-containing protein 6-like [Saccoglossus kowalevskii]